VKVAGWIVLGVLACASAAHANGPDDANAGLAALNAGDYDRAISLFDRALASGQIQGDDTEVAFACRGRAYLKKGDYASAIVDLDRARRIKPDDTDAQNDLVAALADTIPLSSIPGAPRNASISASRPAAKPNALGGLLGALVAGAVAGVQQGLQNADQDPQGPN